MKIKFIITIILISANFLFAQEKIVKLHENEILKIDNNINGKVEKGIYICNKLDWKIKIPENYIVIDQNQLEEMESNGDVEIANKIDYKKNQNSNHLIGFKLDTKNSFTSSYTPLDNLNKYTFEEHKKLFVESLNKAFSTIKDAKFDIEVTDIKIGKHLFYRIKVKGYNSNSQLILTQIYYNSFIDKHLFGVLISYNDEVEGKMLESNFVNSFKH